MHFLPTWLGVNQAFVGVEVACSVPGHYSCKPVNLLESVCGQETTVCLSLRMSGVKKTEGDSKKASDIPNERTGFECAEQVAALLNCIAERSYNEMKCIPLLRKLRACIEKKVSLLVA